MYHGRRDHMVKIHGYRMELGEVEAALHNHAGIQEAIAFAHDQNWSRSRCRPTPHVSVLDVKRHCAERLPRYMIPSDIRLVQSLPRTSSGKIDRVRTKTAVTDGESRAQAGATLANHDRDERTAMDTRVKNRSSRAHRRRHG